ncbi:MAG: LTA synthase family protein [Bacteroidetes bacterium]|nr:MAG: LTA synthase family protein [Bacteroidota bacterium]
MKFISRLLRFFPEFCGIVFLHYGYIVLYRTWGLLAMGGRGNATDILNGIVADVIVISAILLFLYIPYGLIALKSTRKANIIMGLASIFFYVLSAPVQAYFISTSQLLNAAAHNCSVCNAYFAAFNEITLPGWILPMIVLSLAGSWFLWWLSKKRVVFPSAVGKVVLAVLLISLPVAIELRMNTAFLNKNGYRISKPYHFARTGILCITDKITGKASRLTGIELFQSLRIEGSYMSPDAYPLLRKYKPEDCLGRYFKPEALAEKPDIVMIIVEGLSDQFLHPVKGVSFMPFLQELSREGIYWDHFLSTSERDQNTLPSILGGLPYGDNGFTHMPIVPFHFSLLNILKHNHYNTAYFTGQWTWFRSTDKFLSFNNTDVVADAGEFPEEYDKILFGEDDYFWGYNDRALLDFYYKSRVQSHEQQRFDIIQTGSMKSPFFFDNKEHYNREFERLTSSVYNSEDRAFLESKKENLMSAIFTDDMLRQFFEKYAENPGYNNTIFVITGNYPMPGMTANEALNKYHVPLVLYSPALISSERIHTISSHNDIASSLLGFMTEKYSLETPHLTTSTGTVLCTVANGDKTFIPLLDRNGNIREMVYDNYYYDAEQQIYSIGEGFQLQPVAQRRKDIRPQDLLEAFIKVNAKSSVDLMPDSLFFTFFNYTILADTATSGRRVRSEYRNILEDLPINPGIHYIDISLYNPEVAMEEVFVVFELYDESDNLLEWQNFGIPEGNMDFSVRIELDNQYTSHGNTYLKVFLWNQSPIAYSFEKARVVVYTPANSTPSGHATN